MTTDVSKQFAEFIKPFMVAFDEQDYAEDEPEDYELEVGDVVMLASGGPYMTVVGLDDNDVSCTWFNDEDHVGDGTFPIQSLVVFE